MGKITSYPNATTFDSAADVIIKDGTNGTKKMTIDNLAIQTAEYEEITGEDFTEA